MTKLTKYHVALSIIAIIAICLEVSGKQPTAKLDKDANPSYEMTVTVKFGEKTTKYSILSQKGKHLIQVIPPHGKQREGLLSDRDFEYITTEFAKLKVAKVIPYACSRSRVVINEKRAPASNSRKASCLAVRSITTDQYVRFLNILNLAI